MANPKKIPKGQLERVRRLEQALSSHAGRGDLRAAKVALDELKTILNPYGHRARLMQNYMVLYEAALEKGDLGVAKRGFEFVRRNTRSSTRAHLEATALLAIAYLRCRDLSSAGPLIAEVLRNESVIRSEERRRQFHREVIERFDEEGALAALANEHTEVMTEAEIHQRAISLLMQGRNEDELAEAIGRETPQAVKDFLLKVDQLSKNLLTHEERLLLPSPREVIKNRQTGRVVFGGVRRRLYRYICQEDSDVYQAWIKGGLDAILDRGYVTGAVIAGLADLRVGAGAVAVGISALLIKLGIANFCEKSKPSGLMSLRRRR